MLHCRIRGMSMLSENIVKMTNRKIIICTLKVLKHTISHIQTSIYHLYCTNCIIWNEWNRWDSSHLKTNLVWTKSGVLIAFLTLRSSYCCHKDVIDIIRIVILIMHTWFYSDPYGAFSNQKIFNSGFINVHSNDRTHWCMEGSNSFYICTILINLFMSKAPLTCSWTSIIPWIGLVWFVTLCCH